MRVLLVCPYDWEAPGGVQVHVAQLAARLLARGHAVRVLTPSHSTPTEPWVRAVARPVPIAYAGTVAPVAPAPWSIANIRRQLGEFDPDVVHVHEPLTPSTSMYASLVSRVPVVATFHAYLERSRLLEMARPLLRPVFRRLSATIAVSEAAASFAARPFGGTPRIIPNGVEVEAFAPAHRRDRTAGDGIVLWVNRLDPQKGFPVAVEAFRRLAASRAELRLVVAGDGPDRGAVDALEPALRERVEMLGTVAHDRLPHHFGGADVLVSPALGQESFGIVLVEGMSAGVPVVASDIAGYREVVRNGIDGLLVVPGDPQALAEAVARVLDDDGLTASLVAAGTERARSYSWDSVLPRIEAVYADAVSG